MPDARAQVAEIYRAHAAAVYRRARTLLGDDAEANEVMQDLFVSLLERPEQFDARSSLSTFLYSATTHACLNRLRDVRNRMRLIEGRGIAAPQSALATARSHEHADALVLLRQVLTQLPPPLAEVAVYYFVDELSHHEIAKLLGCSRRHVGDLVERLQAWGRMKEATCSTG